MDLLYGLARPALFLLDPERAHNLTMSAASLVSRSGPLRGLARWRYGPKPAPSLAVDAFGLRFSHPLGLAAGLDKDGEAIDFWAAIGFSAIEVGTVTPREGQPGNDRPRLQRLVQDRALVNRMGFNNRGAPQLAAQLRQRETTVPVGANLGKAKTTPLEQAADDYESAMHAVWAHSDYIAVNVSSPNTPGLRDLQAVDSLRPLLVRVLKTNLLLADERVDHLKPILLKLAPDLADEDIDRVADLALELGLDGVIATNTTLRRELAAQPASIEGGLSGAPLRARAEAVTRRLYRRLGGQIPIVGVGGIDGADAAYARIRAGASLLQVFSALIYRGPQLVGEIVDGLAARLAADGLSSIQQAVGLDAGEALKERGRAV